MNTRNCVTALFVILVTFCTSALGAPPPEKLDYRDLIQRPDRWPAEVTMTQQVDFGGGMKLAVGQKLKVAQFNAVEELGVDAGHNQLFAIDPKACDLLEAANATWAKLSPEQRALEPKTVMTDPSLWPAKVTCMSAFTLNSGKDIPPGQEYDLMWIDPNGQVTLWEAEGKAKLTAQISETDAVVRARELVALDPAKRPARIADALKGRVVDSDGKPMSDDRLANQTVFALYYGASWCGPCRSFSPGFVKYVNSIAAANPKLTVVLLSNDEKDADLFKYMKDEKMPFGAVPMKSMLESPLVYCYLRGSIPQLTIVDRNGKIIADSWRGNTYVGPKAAMAVLEQTIKSGAAR